MRILSAVIGISGVALWVYFKFDLTQLLLILLLMWGNNMMLTPKPSPNQNPSNDSGRDTNGAD